MLTDPVAALVEKMGLGQTAEAGIVLVVVLAGTVEWAALVVGASVVGGTFVPFGASVTGAVVAGESPTGGVVVVGAATW
jgi:hypothetical protein